ncbi:hypothetical protein OAU66_00625, partial [bacterium]|nr:hypothetical protein [bacterium]
MKKIITVFTVCCLCIMLMNSCFKDLQLDKVTIGNCDRGDTIINEMLIEGYVDMRSYSPGDTVKFMISCLDSVFSISIARYGAQTHIIHEAQNILGKSQNYDCYSYSYGLEWDILYEFVIPENVLSGLYSA